MAQIDNDAVFYSYLGQVCGSVPAKGVGNLGTAFRYP